MKDLFFLRELYVISAKATTYYFNIRQPAHSANKSNGILHLKELELGPLSFRKVI